MFYCNGAVLQRSLEYFSILSFFSIGKIAVLKVAVCSLSLGEEFKIVKETIPAIYVTQVCFDIFSGQVLRKRVSKYKS